MPPFASQDRALDRPAPFHDYDMNWSKRRCCRYDENESEIRSEGEDFDAAYFRGLLGNLFERLFGYTQNIYERRGTVE